jgi:pimeloyl-ACP methyl ester carboxylesterase
MNPMDFEPMPDVVRVSWQERLRPILRVVRIALKVLLWDPLARRRARMLCVEDGPPLYRLAKGVAYRMSFVPLIIAGIVSALVYAGTHPAQVVSDRDPMADGVYYDAVTFRSDDGVRLESWLVPVVDAKRVLDEQDAMLRKRHPAVVLVHDFGQNRQQMLPLVRPLHDAGFIVLVLNTRGCGSSEPAGVTFGLRESLDVKAAVAMLRKQAFVDPQRIAIVGAGTGGSAAILASRSDSSLQTVVCAGLPESSDQVVRDRLRPRSPLLQWMSPLCRWAFEIAYQSDLEELDPSSRHKDPAVCLKLREGSSVASVEQIKRTLIERLKPEDTQSVSVMSATR